MEISPIPADKLILLIIEKAGGKLSGKTILQKRAYFLTKILELPFDYKPHYYGPYSPEIEAGLGRLKALGFVDEHTVGFGYGGSAGFEMCRYDYQITEDGKIILKRIKEEFPDFCNKIEGLLNRFENAGDTGDYLRLSIAAKAYYILKKHNKPLNEEEIASEAKDFGWKITENSIENAVCFLKKMELVSKKETPITA